MSNNDHPVDQDDAEIEIVDLDGYAEQHEVDIPGAVTPTRVSLRKSLSRQQCIGRLTVTVGIVLLALWILLGSTVSSGLVSIRNGTIAMFTGATPTPTPGADAEYFYFDASPSWGKLSVDGQTIVHPPIIPRDNPLYLSPGLHRLIWTAEPFASQICLLTVPIPSGYASGACPVEPAFQDEFGPTHLNVKANSWQVFFYQSLKALAPPLRTALIQAAQATLDEQRSSETIYPGEHYLLGGNTVTTAKQSLRATLHFQLDTPDEANSPCLQDGGLCSFTVRGQTQNCLWFCTELSQFEYVTEGWNALVIMHALWDYTTVDGQVVAQDQPAAEKSIEPSRNPVIGLQITWDGRNWHVLLINQGGGAPQCRSAFNAMNAYPSFMDAVSVGSYAGVAVSSSGGAVPAQGCLLIIQVVTDNPVTPAPSSSTTAYCLYRFGVLLAANDLAHHYWSSMPLADKYERGLVQRWAA